MNVLVNTSARFSVTPDGRYWAPSENLAYQYWTRFLDVFEHVTVAARSFPVETSAPGARCASGPGVTIHALPNYCGLAELAKQYSNVRRSLRDALDQSEAVYLSVPCILGDMIWGILPAGRPFAVGVCGDPYDAMSPGASTHPLRPVLQWWLTRQLRRECRAACACTYVTERALQRRYPCRPGTFQTHYSSINLVPDAIVNASKRFDAAPRPARIINVGTFDTWYKGTDVLLRSLSECLQRGVDLQAVVIGDGRYRADAERLSAELGLTSRVKFLGQLPYSAAVREQLDNADLFVLPSRQEGVPKAMIEAMARGLPCIGTTVGGIPELLAEEDVVEPNDAAALSRLMESVIGDPRRLNAMAERNLAKAQEYSAAVLRKRRIELYTALRDRTAEWLDANRMRRAVPA